MEDEFQLMYIACEIVDGTFNFFKRCQILENHHDLKTNNPTI